jgi:hypothetical protein
LKGSTFERDMVLEVAVILEGNREVGLPLEVSVFKEEHHGAA